MASDLTDDEAEAMLKVLSRHYHQPVMPINRYCKALRTWQTVLDDRVANLKAELFPGIHGSHKAPETVKAYEAYRKEVHGDGKRDTLSKRGDKIDQLIRYEQYAESVHRVFLDISKSNLLARLLYAGEKLRTKMCPKHKGHWSGIEWGPDNACPHKCQLTGWIQEEIDQGKPLPGVQAVVTVLTGIKKPDT